jgi:hypothetical protein
VRETCIGCGICRLRPRSCGGSGGECGAELHRLSRRARRSPLRRRFVTYQQEEHSGGMPPVSCR